MHWRSKVKRLCLVLGTAWCVMPTFAHGDELHADWKKTGNAKAVKLEQCVEDTEVMRRSHMQFLMHQRDETMHKGIRTKNHSLVNCIDCHANKNESGKFIPVNATGQFCQTCHAFAGVSMDCFQCHATKPRENMESAYLQPLLSPVVKKSAHTRQRDMTQFGPAVNDSTTNGLLIGPVK